MLKRNLNTTGLLRLHTRCTWAFSYVLQKTAHNDAADVLSEKRVWTNFMAARFLRWLNYKQCGKSRFWQADSVRYSVSAKECMSSSRVCVSSQMVRAKRFPEIVEVHSTERRNRLLLTHSTANVLAPFNPTSRNLQSRKGASRRESRDLKLRGRIRKSRANVGK